MYNIYTIVATKKMAENKSKTKIFKMTNFSPVGFIVANYPTKFCSLCRGYLHNVCSTCMENKHRKCEVTEYNGSYYHRHCYELINSLSNQSF